MPYLLDANVFIQAKNLHYGFDFCPAFRDWLDYNPFLISGNSSILKIIQIMVQTMNG